MIPLQKILFISFDHIGDILRYTPMLRTLRINYPNAYIACLLGSAQGAIMQYYPYVDDVILFPHDEIRNHLGDDKNLAEVVYYYGYRLINVLRRTQYDLVINLFTEIGAQIAGLVNPKQVLGHAMVKHGEYKVFGEHAARFFYLISKQNELRVQTPIRMSDSALTVLQDIGIHEEEKIWRKPEFFYGPGERKFAAKFLRDYGVREDDFLIGLQTTAMLSRKRCWPAEKFATLTKRLHEHHAVKFILFGSPEEKHIIEKELVPLLSVPYIMAAGNTKLLEAGALLDRVNLLVTNDTGPMHMAASLGTPVVALFGGLTSIIREAKPYGDNHTVLAKDETKDIAVDDVYAAVEKYLV